MPTEPIIYQWQIRSCTIHYARLRSDLTAREVIGDDLLRYKRTYMTSHDNMPTIVQGRLAAVIEH